MATESLLDSNTPSKTGKANIGLFKFYFIVLIMSLAHPSLTTLGKKKSKVKFRNAEQARQARELAESWEVLQNKWGVTNTPKKKSSTKPLSYSLSVPEGRRTAAISSKGNGIGVATKTDAPVYTGTKCKGVGVMHKSNSVPIFSDDEAVAIARMRR